MFREAAIVFVVVVVVSKNQHLVGLLVLYLYNLDPNESQKDDNQTEDGEKKSVTTFTILLVLLNGVMAALTAVSAFYLNSESSVEVSISTFQAGILALM